MTRFAWFTLMRLTSISRWLNRRFTAAGLLVLGGAWAGAVFGVDTERSMTYQAFCLLIAAVIVAMPFALRFRPRLIVARELPRLATAGMPFSYRVQLHNDSAAPQSGLSL